MLNGIISFVKHAVGWDAPAGNNQDVDELAQSFTVLSLDENDRVVIPIPRSSSENLVDSSSEEDIDDEQSGIINYVKRAVGWDSSASNNLDINRLGQSILDRYLDKRDKVVISMPLSSSTNSVDSSSEEDIDLEQAKSPQIRNDQQKNSKSESSKENMDELAKVKFIQFMFYDLFEEINISEDEVRLFLRAQRDKKITDILSLLDLAIEKNNFHFFIYLSMLFKESLDSEELSEYAELKKDITFTHNPPPAISSKQALLYKAAELGNLNFFIRVEQEVGVETNAELNEVLSRAKQCGYDAITDYLQNKYPNGIVAEAPARVITPRFAVYVIDVKRENQATPEHANERLTSSTSAQSRPSQ